MRRLTSKQLAEIRTRHAGATPGPWAWERPGAVIRVFTTKPELKTHRGKSRDGVATGMSMANAEFIAHAWQDVAQLLAELERRDGYAE